MGAQKRIQINLASVTGRNHLRIKKNNQDGVMSRSAREEGKEYFFGVICDGCSQGSSNEVGAKLLSSFICTELPLLLSSGVPAEEIPNVLFTRCIGYLRGIAGQTVTGPPETLTAFVANYLLCTVLGFLVWDKRGLIFSAGDGLIITPEFTERINQENKPHYLGYHLINRQLLKNQGASLPGEFQVRELELGESWKLAVCSDGFEEEVAEKLWGHKNSLSLQRELNKLSYFENRFSDDCSVIVAEDLL